jgi:long-subunit acyl-CoA synthetase (AMP-forming)
MVLAAIKTGYRILLPSTRNSHEGHVWLIRSTDCTNFFHGAESKSDAEDLASCFDGSVASFEIPSLKQLIEGDAEFYADGGGGDSMDIAVIIHTSGSTGLPRPIGIRHGYIAIESSLSRLETPNGRRTVANVHGGTFS